MKRLIITGITTVALAAAAVAEDQVPKRAASRGANRATAATTTARTNTGANTRARQFSARQNTSTRALNRQATVNTQNTVRANRVTARERNVAREQNFRRAQTTTTTPVVTNTTTGGRVARREALREQRAQQRFVSPTTTNRNVVVNRTRNVNRNVTLVNNWRSAQFAGRPYTAFRNYHRAWHDRGWWDAHYGPSLTFVFGAPYFWSGGYWYPAWGYNPGYAYPYDGPIYGAQTLSPEQIVMNVQAQLQRDGYYDGPIDGLLGPNTRYALAAFQADHGLAVTSAVDEPTLSTLGLV
jgi:Putative peptidoglycan binding domain